MENNVDIMQAERIAILETKVDDLSVDVKAMKGLLEPMVALYKAGRFVIWASGAILSFTHWDQIVAFVHQFTQTPKHP